MSYHHGDLKNALVAAAAEVLVEQGPEALSLREVARRAGVSHAAPYRHFADRQALLAAIAEDGFVMLDAMLVRASRRRDTTAAQRLWAALDGYLRFCGDHPHHARLMFGTFGPEKPAALAAAAATAFARLVALVTEAMDESTGEARVSGRGRAPDDARVQANGEGAALRPRDPRAVALALWAQTHGFSVLGGHMDFAALVPQTSGERIIRHALKATMHALIATGQGRDEPG